MTTYVTFGQSHIHEINGTIFDKDCVAVISSDTALEGRKRAFELFGPKFCFEYFDEVPEMRFFPRGLISVE